MAPRNPSRSRASGPGCRHAATGKPGARPPPAGSTPRNSERPVRIHNGHPRLRLPRRQLAAAIHLLDAHAADIVGPPAAARRSPAAGPPPGELSLAFLTAPALAALHGRFLGDPSATDVITFAAAPALGQAGEICVSADAARDFARRHGRDFAAELTLYVVHGWLHLAGHDDRQPAKKRRMRAAEARALAVLRAAGAIPRFRLR
jgi:probable rRNA maturation factor